MPWSVGQVVHVHGKRRHAQLLDHQRAPRAIADLNLRQQYGSQTCPFCCPRPYGRRHRGHFTPRSDERLKKVPLANG